MRLWQCIQVPGVFGGHNRGRGVRCPFLSPRTYHPQLAVPWLARIPGMSGIRRVLESRHRTPREYWVPGLISRIQVLVRGLVQPSFDLTGSSGTWPGRCGSADAFAPLSPRAWPGLSRWDSRSSGVSWEQVRWVQAL